MEHEVPGARRLGSKAEQKRTIEGEIDIEAGSLSMMAEEIVRFDHRHERYANQKGRDVAGLQGERGYRYDMCLPTVPAECVTVMLKKRDKEAAEYKQDPYYPFA